MSAALYPIDDAVVVNAMAAQLSDLAKDVLYALVTFERSQPANQFKRAPAYHLCELGLADIVGGRISATASGRAVAQSLAAS